MPERHWLARLLPEEAAREWYTPALHDLEIARALARRRGIARPVARLRFIAGALGLYLDCLRLCLTTRSMWRRAKPRSAPPRRREHAAMLLRDFRHALRLFMREPGFSAAAVLTLALGIGVNTALFALVEAVLLRPLPFSASDELVMLEHQDLRTGIRKDFVALGDVIDLRQRQQSLDALVAFNNVQSTLMDDNGDPWRAEGLSVTPEFFRALAVEPSLGRFFEPGDLREGAPSVAVISHELWTTRFGSSRDVIGRSIQLGTAKRLIVGVAPRGLRFPPSATTDIIVPLRLPPAAPSERRQWIHAMGRLRTGTTAEQANSELTTLSRQFEQEFPASNQGTRYNVLSLRDAVVGDTKRPLLLLWAAVGFVLLITCVNVGNLLLARSLTRQQEMAMRLALGAGRWRVGQQIMVEALVLGLTGCGLGVLIAWRLAPALAPLLPGAARIPGLAHVSMNVPVLLFSLGAALAAAIVFGAIAAIGLTGASGAQIATRRTTMSTQARRAASALVAAEVALAVVLVMAATLTLRSFGALISVDPGFKPDHVLNVQVGLPPGRYADVNARRAVFDRAFEAIHLLPGVVHVGAGVVTPLTGNNWTIPLVRPERQLGAGERPADVGWQLASEGYFRALDIPLRAGRLFTTSDRPDTAPVVIVSEGLAASYFPGENPVGKQVMIGTDAAQIVGVVGDIRRAALSDRPRADMYLAFERAVPPAIGIFVRTTGDPADALPAIRTALRSVEPNTVVYGATTLAEVAAESAAVARVSMQLLGGLAGIAVLLAAIGIYGVMSYSVRRRTRELGTRLALGATRYDIQRLVLKQTSTIAVTGSLVGVALGLGSARSLTAILFGVPPWDPFAILASLAVLAATTLMAGYLPARRASRIDPAKTLASE